MRYTRIAAIFLVTAIFAMTSEAKLVRYEDSDNGILGTLDRTAAGKVGFTHLANILSGVMKDSDLDIGDLTRLQKGRKILVRDRYLDPAFRPSKEMVAASKRILMIETARLEKDTVDLTEVSVELRAAYEEQIKDLKEQLQTSQDYARLTAANSNALKLDLNVKLKAATARAETSEAEAAMLRRQSRGARFGWFIAGLLLALFLTWVWYRTVFVNKHVVHAKTVWGKAPNGTWKKFTYNEERGGYDCEDCVSGTCNTEGLHREHGIGVMRKNLSKHLEEAKCHRSLWIERAA